MNDPNKVVCLVAGKPFYPSPMAIKDVGSSSRESYSQSPLGQTPKLTHNILD